MGYGQVIPGLGHQWHPPPINVIIGRLAGSWYGIVQVSVDTLRPDRFVAITRRNGLDAVLSSLYAALELGYGGR